MTHPNDRSEVRLPFVENAKVTAEVVAQRDAILHSLNAVNISEAEQLVYEQTNIPPGTLRRYKAELRKLLNIPPRTALAVVAAHPQVKDALESLLVREIREDKGRLRSAKGLSVVMPTSGEQLTVEEFLKSLYPREGVNATSCYNALVARCKKKQVVHDDLTPCAIDELPSRPTVIKFLRQWRKEYVAVRRGRSRKHDFETMQEPYVTRDPNVYRAGELWIGDHTELDFMVINGQGKPDRRWITAFIDIRTKLIVGYHLSWQPNSQTIALAYRCGVVASQLRAFTGETFEKLNFSNVPKVVMLDNGKDYRSNYTKRIFGKIDFDDFVRVSVQRLTKLHYTTPYHGQSKAQMERWFRTIQTMLKYLPGFKGNKYQNKPDSLAGDLKRGNILPVEQFDAIVAVAVNSYNNRPHRSLQDQSPLQCYLTNQTQQRSIDLHVLDFLMLKAQGRRIHRCQVTLFGKEYYSESLLAFNDKQADVYYDPNDLGFISVYVEGIFAAIAGNKEMIGQTERGWEKILRDRKHGEKDMQTQLAGFKKGMSDDVARRLLLEGELLNMTTVSQELLAKSSTPVTLLTGLEETSKDNQQAMEVQKNLADIEKKAHKRSKSTPLSIAVINERVK